MKAAVVLCLLALVSGSRAQVINTTAIEAVLNGYTGGQENYLTTLASTLASGFVSSVSSVISNISAVVKQPQDYATLLLGLEDQFCTPAFINSSTLEPASITGPAIDLAFSGGACIVNDTDWVSGITVDCIAPSATISILPAVLTSPYQTPTMFTDTECRLEKTFGVASDNIIFVLENGAFNISALVSTLEAGLTSVLGEFSSLAGDVVGSPALSATLAAVNAASTLLG